MGILQLIFTGGVVLTIVLVIFFIYFFVSLVVKSRTIKKLKKVKKSRKQKRKLVALQQNKQQAIYKLISCFILAGLAIAGSWYINYYQSTNLSTEDMANITDGYYYLRDLKDELETIQAGESDNEKSQQAINFVVTSLAAYSVKKASTLNTVEGQSILNRYYNAMSELGINTSKNSKNIIKNPDALSESLSDIKKVQTYQNKVIDYYKVDASALEAQK